MTATATVCGLNGLQAVGPNGFDHIVNGEASVNRWLRIARLMVCKIARVFKAEATEPIRVVYYHSDRPALMS